MLLILVYIRMFTALMLTNGRYPLLLIALLLLSSCDEVIPQAVQDTYEEATLTPLPTPTDEATPTSIPSGAEGIGLAFFRAWEAGDYLGMYSLLSPQSQSLVDSRSFVKFYEEMMGIAAVQSISTQPLSARQDGDRAEFGARVTWDSAVVGQVSRDHSVELIFNDGRWGIIWDESLILPEMEGGHRLFMEYRIPARANIYDRQGEALAYQGTLITLGVIPGRIEDEEGLLSALGEVLDMEEEEILLLYASALPDWYVPIGDITGEVMQENYELLSPFIDAGLVTNDRLTRLYSKDGIAPHVVGYTGYIPAEEIDSYTSIGYRGDEYVGLAGIENWGEKYLNGTRGGVLSVVGPSGEQVATIAESEPRQARNIFVSFDTRFQSAVEQALAEAIETHPLAERGSVVVLDTETGAVRAVASFPDYDPAIFDGSRLDSGIELSKVLNDPNQPLLNRATQGEYPAGSTFKIITFSAAVGSGLYEPSTKYASTGSWDGLGESFIKYDWREGGHGNISLSQALVVSCNSCFYDAGFNIDAVDPYIIPTTARQFGLDAPTDIVGIPENDGLIPDPEWKLANVGEGWVPGDSVNMAIGQGYVQITPLQLARIIAAVANGGTLYQPTLIDRIGAGGGAPEESWPSEAQSELPISDEHLAVIQGSLRDVADSVAGTASHQFVGLPVPVAGKTGTAETVIDTSHAWFAGYAPAEPYTQLDGTVIEEPEIAIVVMIENAGEGSDVAAPIFRRVVELYYDITPTAPYPW